MDIDDSKYEALVAAKAESETKVTELTAQVAEKDKTIETLEAEKLKAGEERDAEKQRADAAEEASRVAAMKDGRMSALGTGFRAKLDKLETTAKVVARQAAELTDEQWDERLAELEESLEVKRDAKLDAKPAEGENEETKAGLLFDRKDVTGSKLGKGAETEEVTADEDGGGVATTAPSVERRQSVMGGLVRPRKKETAKA